MLGKLRNFSKSKLAGVLVVIIIIPFVFWGMGSVFSGGNKNNLAIINGENISSQDFIDYVNNSNIDIKTLKNNIENNVLEELLSQLISYKLLSLETERISLSLSDKGLFEHIVKDVKFSDDSGVFSRLKYEKFLLENNINAVNFEKRLKENIIQRNLFQYISGGIISPNFLVKNLFLENTRQINIEFINLEENYKKEFSDSNISEYINNNKDELKKDFIDINYVKFTPKDITNKNEFDKNFFEELDKIENELTNGAGTIEIAQKFDLEVKTKKNYFYIDKDELFLKEIYNERKNFKSNILDKEDYYIIYEITNLSNKIPEITNEDFFNEVVNKLRSKNKFEYNKNILKKIENNKFNNDDFINIAKKPEAIKKMVINSINDNSFFDIDSLKLLYSIPQNDFLLIVDNKKNVYLTKVKSFSFKDFLEKNDNYNKFFLQSNYDIKNNISSTYDSLLNNKYEITVNQNTLDRLKNFF
tara:strand:+ start:374 stop:1792 length:1419 start_codon:yes stop_codon:yes gene_type:complete